MKRVLILGKKSYLGESLNKWLLQYPDKYEVRIMSGKKPIFLHLIQ